MSEDTSIFAEDEAGVIDLGHGVRMKFWTQASHEGERCGLIEEHPRPDGRGLCSGGVTFRGYEEGGRPSWEVISMEPLTLSPSLLCRTCGHHGFIRDGKWCPA